MAWSNKSDPNALRRLQELAKEERESKGNSSVSIRKDNPTSTKKNDTSTATKEKTETKTETRRNRTSPIASKSDPAALQRLQELAKVERETYKARTTPSWSSPATLSKPTDYESAVKYLESKGVKYASGIKTESEWRRGNKYGETYQNYLDRMISKYDNGTSFDDLDKRYEDAKNRVQSMEDYYKRRYQEETDRIKRENPNDYAFPVAAHASAIVRDEFKADEAEFERAKAEYQQLERLLELNAHTKAISSKEDFEQNSKYSPSEPKTEEELIAEGYKKNYSGEWYKQNFFSGYADYYTGEDSDLYLYINDESKREDISNKKIMQTSQASTAMGGGAPSGGTDIYAEMGYHTLTEEEKGAFNYLYHQDKINGTKTAEEYLKNISPLLQERAMQLEAKRYANLAKEAPVAMSAISLGTNLQNAFMFPTKVVATATGTYEDMPILDTYGNKTQAIRGAVGEDLGYWGNLLYQGGMSLGDMGVAMGLGGGNAKLIQFIMSSSAGSSKISEAKKNGASDGKALALGVGSAVIEWATEKYSVEAILKEPESIFKYILTNVVTEGTEEGASNVSNIALDAIVSEVFGDRNEIERRIDELVLDEGKSEKEALKTVFNEKLQSLGEDVLVGGLTGFGMSSTMASPKIVEKGINAIQNKADKTIAGKGTTANPTAEQPTTEPDTLEKAAMDVVASRNAPETAKTEPILNVPVADDSLPTQEGKSFKTYRMNSVLGDTERSIGTAGGQAFVTNSKDINPSPTNRSVFLPVNDTEVAKTEFGANESNKTSENISKILASDFVPVRKTSVDGTLEGVGEVRVYTDENGREIALESNVAEYFDGYNLEATFRGGKPYAIKATDNEGNVAGVAMAIWMDSSGQKYNISQEETSLKSPLNVRRGISLAEQLEAQSKNNEPIAVADVKRVTGFGDSGASLVADYSQADGVTFSQVATEVKASYMSGFNNPDLDASKMRNAFTSPRQMEAYKAGQIDAKMQNLSAQEDAKSATVYEDGLVENENFKSLPKTTQELFRMLAKDHKMSVEMKDYILAAETIDENGRKKRYYANASHADGRLEASMGVKPKLLFRYAIHEDGHRMEQMATEEWNALSQFAYARAERRANNKAFDNVKRLHDNAGITLTTRGYAGEVVMRELETVFSSEKEYVKFLKDLDSSPKAKSGFQKFMQHLFDIIKELKWMIEHHQLSAEGLRAAKAELAELEQFKELYGKAYLATRDAVNNVGTSQTSESVSNSKIESKSVTLPTQDKTSLKSPVNTQETKAVSSKSEATKKTAKPKTKSNKPSVKVGDSYKANGTGKTYTITGRNDTHTTYTVTNKNGKTTTREITNKAADINFNRSGAEGFTKIQKSSGIKAGDVFTAKNTGTEYKIVARDDKNTTVEITSEEGTKTMVVSNEIADINFSNMSAEGITKWIDEDLHIDNRSWEDASDRKVKAFQFLFPEFQEYYAPLAQELLGDLDNTIKGERIAITHDNGQYSADMSFTGVKRLTSDAIARIKDATNATYDDIRNALNRLINDEGQENIALAKKIELVLDEMLTDGYNTFDGQKIPPNTEYIAKKEELLGKTYDAEASDNYDGWEDLMGSWSNDGVSFALMGVREDGIEVYETSKEVMQMSVSERKKRYIQLMNNEYAGRTARFVRNGHTYYAEFDRNNLRKPMYGDNRSSESGKKALTRVGADGDVFDLVENSTYDHSTPDNKNHKNTDYFDYFIKTVQIDNKVYDLHADVKKQYGKNGGYVYTLVLTDNKKIKVAPTKASKNGAFKFVGTTSNGRLSQNTKSVKKNFSLVDSDGSVIDAERISNNVLDIRYSLHYADEIAMGQTEYIDKKKAHITKSQLKNAQKVTRAMVDVMMKYSSILPEDKIGKVLTKNGSYDRSVENTTICVRTLAYNEFVDKVQEELGRPLTQMESFLVSQKLYDIATEPQCLYCYVSLDRKAFNDMLLRYVNDRDTVIAKYNNSEKSPKAISKLYEEFLNGRKDTKEMKTRFNKWLDYVDNGTQLLSLADIATDARQTAIKSKGGILAEQLADARKYAQSASWSKIQKNYVAYRDEILKLGDRVVKNLNEHYGLRWYSFSDYSAAFIVENMQQITDASIRGLKGLAYTKDTDFAEIFAPSGMNINISVFVNQDADGNFFIDEKQSADFKKAIDLRKRYSNVGIVATVTNDEALKWVGEQDWSDVIIPFHVVRTGTDVANYYKWLNYTTESADTIKDKDLWNSYVDSLNLKSDNARKKVSKNIYPSEHKNDKSTYLALCESRGLTPRFARFVGESWYMKLVNETRLSAEESSVLQPNYNLDAAQKSFKKFVDKGGYEGGWYKESVNVDEEAKVVASDVLAGKKANEVDYGRQDNYAPEKLIAKRKTVRTHGKSYSLVDSEGNTLTEAQQEYFKDSKVRDENGNLLVMYHGTSKGGFTVFDTYAYYARFGLFGNGAYFTDNKEIAEQYTRKGRGNNPQVYSAYLNITNPIDMDAKADIESWNKSLQKTGEDFSLLEGEMTNEQAFKIMVEDLEYAEVYTYDAAEIVRNVFENMGYDGITHIGGGRVKQSDGTKHRVFIAFEQEQIKDVNNPNPTSNPDINFSLKEGKLSKRERQLEKAFEDAENGKKGSAERLAKYIKGGTMPTELYKELIEKYGVIPTGEKPFRDVQVPQKTAKNKKVSQTVRTILEAEATPDEAVPTIEKMVEDGIFSYDAYSDKQAIENGEDYIKEHGWEQSLVDWFDAVNKGEVSKDITTTGWILYNHAANSGDAKTAIMILDAMVRHQRSAAQALQATRILKKFSPEAQLYGVQKSVEAFQRELTEKYGDKAPDLKIDEDLAEQFMNAKTEEERTKVEKEIYKDIGRQMPSRFMDKWNAWRYLAMLGNPRTHIRNIGGNAFFAPIVATKNLTATAIESVVYRVSRKKMVRGKSLITGNKADRALLKAAWADYGTVADMISNGGKYNDSALANQSIEDGRKIFKGIFTPIEWARKGNSKLLEAEDMWFARPHYAFALAQYCKANNITAEQIKNGKAIAPAREYAIKEAQKATYRDTNAFSQMVSEWGRSNKNEKNIAKKAFNTVIEGILPFRKTPANILVRGIEYSPIGLLKGLSYDLVQVGKGNMSASQAIDNISAGLTGTGLLALGIYLAAQGLVRGHGEDEKEEKEFNELMGRQAYAIELPNGQSITLDWLAPEALPFFVGVNIWETTSGTDEEVNLSSILKAVTGITEPMLEMSCLQSLNDIFESVGYASSNDTSGLISVVSSAATSYLTQAFPTLLGQAERTGEEERMTTYTEKNDFLTGDMQYTLGKVSAKIPFWDYHQIPYIDAWGRREASGTALKRGLNNFLNPAYTSTIDESAMEKELLRLYESTGETKVFPSRADKYFTVDKARKDLTADEYVRYATLKGEKSYKLVSDLVNSKAYKKLDDGEKVKAISEAYDYANQKAKQAVSNYKGDSWVATADEFGKGVGNYLAFRADYNDTKSDNGGKIEKTEVIDIIMDMAQNDNEVWLMYLDKYDSENAQNVRDKGIEGETYLNFLDALDEVDEPTKSGKYGSYTQDEAKKAVNRVDGLTRKEKSILWQSVNSSWKNNPF
jgi:hypothetical protein